MYSHEVRGLLGKWHTFLMSMPGRQGLYHYSFVIRMTFAFKSIFWWGQTIVMKSQKLSARVLPGVNRTLARSKFSPQLLLTLPPFANSCHSRVRLVSRFVSGRVCSVRSRKMYFRRKMVPPRPFCPPERRRGSLLLAVLHKERWDWLLINGGVKIACLYLFCT